MFAAGCLFTKGLEMNIGTKAKLQLITALLIFGTIGTVRRNILLPTSLIVVARGIIGSPFLLFLHIFKRQSFNKNLIRKRLP